MAAISEPANRRRGPGRPWRPGESGNPSGLPKDVAPAIQAARRLALQHAPRAIERLASMLDSDDERVVIAAAEGILDRAGLKPFAVEPERIEIAATPVDLDALRAALADKVAGLAGRAAVDVASIEAPALLPGMANTAPRTERDSGN